MKTRSEAAIIALISAVQFINVLDFMMVMPLGPDFAKALGIPSSNLGLIGGSYTAAATIAGLLGSLFLDRYDRRKALFASMIGLALATIAGAAATNLETLMIARVAAGVFGGPATSLSLSIIADVVPPARRGRAMGIVMGAFSIASILGVPAGLELARLGGWRVPFIVVGSVCLVVAVFAHLLLPSMTAHFKDRANAGSYRSLFRPLVLQSYSMMALHMFTGFLLIPNFSAYFQFNLGYPREKLGFLYMVGGLISFVGMRIAGKLVDRFGAFRMFIPATLFFLAIVYLGYYSFPPYIPALGIFVGFMLGMSSRGVALMSLATRVPAPAERARYMSFQSAVQHFSCTVGAVLAAKLLSESPEGHLVGMPLLCLLSMAGAAIMPFILRLVERSVKSREAASAAAIAQQSVSGIEA